MTDKYTFALADNEPTLRDNEKPEPPANIAELAIFELTRIMSGQSYVEPHETGRAALLRSGLAEEANVSGAIVVTDVGQAVWRDIVARVKEELVWRDIVARLKEELV